MTEHWRPIVGFEGWYEVSDLGRVRRIRPGKSTYVGKILSPCRHGKRGHRAVYLHRDGRDTQQTVHRLVAATFIGPCPEGKEVNHIDGNPANNRLDNLEYVTRSENVLHAYRLGLEKPQQGENHGASKLTTEQVIVIRNCSPSVPSTVIARAFGVSKPTIQRIRDMKNWKHIPLSKVIFSDRPN